MLFRLNKLLLPCLMISKKAHQRQSCLTCIFLIILIVVLHESSAVSANTEQVRSNEEFKTNSAILEVRQQNSVDGADKEVVALLLNGRYFSGRGGRGGNMQKQADGQLIELPGNENCGNRDEGLIKQHHSAGWIAVIHLESPSLLPSSSSSSSSSSNNNTECFSFLDRLKNIMLLGASAVILLSLNPKILQELDVAQILSRPMVLVEDADNITVLLNALRSKLRLRMRLSHGSNTLYDMQTFTTWSVCWRSRPGSGVVCKSDNKLSKADPGQFWSYFYWSLAVVMLLLMLKTSYRNDAAATTTTTNTVMTMGADDDNQMVNTITKMALSLLKTKRYKNPTKSSYLTGSHCNDPVIRCSIGSSGCSSSSSCRGCGCGGGGVDNGEEFCAICLDVFYRRQLIRVLPCSHEFHSKCVDRWLLMRQTCPLCKNNFIESQLNEGTIERILFSRYS
ncbi:hypothetical protein HELRODRAFT_193049 [Helobdella robusta]|uniref:RING-type domain-containing protein n=1 Tax=Helobdella robusta TaxID=6412 RepID=T1FUK4_HELRO|nr:hypothetical protein HELRODRAFT_193049 [Helobdella robusta]ESN98322.1 hypothetical protein HELRODRAFT_193049 [Helobdella robusta]